MILRLNSLSSTFRLKAVHDYINRFAKRDTNVVREVSAPVTAVRLYAEGFDPFSYISKSINATKILRFSGGVYPTPSSLHA